MYDRNREGRGFGSRGFGDRDRDRDRDRDPPRDGKYSFINKICQQSLSMMVITYVRNLLSSPRRLIYDAL